MANDVFEIPTEQGQDPLRNFSLQKAMEVSERVQQEALAQAKSTSSFHAAETLELTSLQSKQQIEDGYTTNPEDLVRIHDGNKKFVESVMSELNMHPAKTEQVKRNENSTLNGFKETAEGILSNTTDPTEAATKLKLEAEKTKQIVQEAKKAGVTGAGIIFDEAAASKLNAKERQNYMMSFEALNLLSQGHDPISIENTLKRKYRTPDFIAGERARIEGKIVDGGNTEPMYSPEWFIVDVLMGPAAVLIDPLKKSAIKLAWQKGAAGTVMKLIGKETGKSVTFGALAGGFMTAADLAGAGKAVQITSGIIGPIGTYGLITASRRGLVNILGSLWSSKNKPLVEQMEKSLKGQTDKFSKTALEVIAEIKKNGLKDAKITVKPPRSAGARIADTAKEVGDKKATETLATMVKQVAPLETDTPIKQTIAEVLGTGEVSPFNPVALTLDAESVVLRAVDKAPTKIPVDNRVHKNSIVVGKPGEGAHITEEGFAYRSLSQKEIDAIRKTGSVLPNPSGKSKGGAKNAKHWSEGDGRVFYNPDKLVIRAPLNKVGKAAVDASDVEVWNAADNTWEKIVKSGVGSIPEELLKKVGLWEAGRNQSGKFAPKSRGDSQNIGNMLDAKTNGFPTNTKNMTESIESAFNGDSTTITTSTTPNTPWVEKSPLRIMDTMTDLADNLNNANAIAEQVVPKIMFEEVSKRQSYVNDIIHQRMYKREVDMGPTDLGWKGKNIRGILSQIFTVPEFSLKDLANDLVVKPTINEYEANRLAKAGKDALKGIFKGLKGDERERLVSLLEMGNDFEEVFIATKGGLKDSKGNFHEASPSTIDAYFASRNLFDHYHWLANNTAVNQARARGFQVLEDQFLVEVKKTAKLGEDMVNRDGVPVKWSKANKEAGDVVVHTKDEAGNPMKMVFTQDEANQFLKQVPDNYQMIGYKQGYLPIIYKDKYAITMLEQDGANIKSRRIATAKNFREAERAVSRLKAQNPDANFVAHRKHEDAVDTVYDTTFAQSLHNMTQGELEAIKKGLREAGVEEDVIDQFERGAMTFSHQRNNFFKERGQERLKSAETVEITPTGKVEGRKAPFVPTEQALAKYINAISKYTSHTEWNAKLQQQFLEKYGEVLTTPSQWDSGIKTSLLFKSGEKQKLAYEAFVVKDQLERIFGIRSFIDMGIESYRQHAVASLYDKGNPIATMAASIIDELPNFFKVVNLLKSVGAVTKLGLGNISQLVVQATASLNVVGRHLLTDPHVIGEGTVDFMQALVPMVFKVKPDADAAKLHSLMERSGFLAGFDYTELQRIATNVESWSALGVKRKVGKALEAGEMFWKGGEGITRGVSWFVERRALINQIKSGKNTAFSAKDIDGDKFLDAVSERAMVTALNMTRFNQAFIARGLMGVPLQFKQFAIQQLRAMTNKKNLSWAEMAGIWATWTGIFGINGVPLFMDAIVFGEDQAGEKHPEAIGGFRRWEFEMADYLGKTLSKAGLPENAAFWQRWIDKGPVKALTDGQIDIANRSTVSMIFNHFQDAQPYSDWGPSISIIHKTLSGGVKGVTDLYNAMIEGEANPSSVLADLTQVVGEAAGIANPIIAARAKMEGPLRGKDGKISVSEPTLSELAQQAMGITPGRVVDVRDRNFVSYRVVKAWKDWGKAAQERILEAYNGQNYNYAQKIFDEYLIQAATYNPRLASKFQKATMMNLMQAGTSKELKSEMMAVNNAFAFDDEELKEILVGGN